MRVTQTSIPPLPTTTGSTKWLSVWQAELSGLFDPKHLRADLWAGAEVAGIAVPLSLAIALASDVDAPRGLVTAVVGGALAALFASSRLAISGPAAAMAVLIGQVVDVHGLPGLLFVTVGAGLLQLLTGALGLGFITQLVPRNVVHGFTAGIGIVILIGQLPRALGLPAPDESHALDVVAHVGQLVQHAHPSSVVCASLVAVPMLVGARFAPKVPFALLGVVAATLFAWGFDAEVTTLGTLAPPASLRATTGRDLAYLPLIGDTLAVYALGSLETLLCIQSLEKLRPGERHDPNHEMVGQGIANVVAGAFGGLPVTAVITRSALNVRAGARTRRSGLFHALLVGAVFLLASPLLDHVPVAALGGVLIAVAILLIDFGHFRRLAATAKSEALIFAVTALVMVLSGLLVGVQAGLLAACVVTMARLARASVRLVPAHDDEPHHILLDGSLTFLSAPRLETLGERLREATPEPGCIVDMRHLTGIDTTSVDRLASALRMLTDRGGNVAVLGPNQEISVQLAGHLPERSAIVHADSDAYRWLGRDRGASSGRKRMASGLSRFKREVRPRLSPMLSRLAAGQAPHTMMLTCADSRVVPSLLTGSGPGEVFTVRNIGALMPPFGSETLNDEGAALEYAISVLGVRHVVVCAHSRCGAMTAICTGKLPPELPALHNWCAGARPIAGVDEPSDDADIDAEARKAAIHQLENLRGYPVVREYLDKGELHLDAWFYDVESSGVDCWNPATEKWESLTD